MPELSWGVLTFVSLIMVALSVYGVSTSCGEARMQGWTVLWILVLGLSIIATTYCLFMAVMA